MRSVMSHSFSEVPKAEIPRSSFDRSSGYKTTFNAGDLVPVFWEEVIPGDTVSIHPTMFARLNTPIYPIIDNMFLDIHWFFVPYRQVWTNFRKFMGEREDPADSIDYTIPYMAATAVTGYSNETLQDYLGLPTKIPDYQHSALPLRCYNHIYNEWFRDENLIDSAVVDTDNGPDTVTDYVLRKRGKRHDYFTSSLPWLQRGDAIDLPLGTEAPVTGLGVESTTWATGPQNVYETEGSGTVQYADYKRISDDTVNNRMFAEEDPDNAGYPHIYADLSNATAATINELRQAFQIQRLLERDARSGTRYAEIVRAHFGVQFMDVTYRPEFLGGASVPINIQQVPQTSETNTTAQGTMAAYGTATLSEGGFTKSFTEHGLIMGIASARADLTYQQGLERAWSRSTRYDFYFPALAHLGEQSVLVKEIYCDDPSTDTGATGTPNNERVFGYQERWAEMRYRQSKITGKLRSNDAASLDAWHLSQEFASYPTLGQTFIEEDPPMSRVVAVNTEPDFLMDCYFRFNHVRPMPIYSVPGLIDHF